MLTRCVRAEGRKLKHSVIFLACVVIPLIPAVMGTFNYLQNLGVLKSEWYSLWTQITLFYANFFYAPLVALYCSYLWRLEHLNNNWNVLMTAPVSVVSIYFGKLVIILKVTAFTQLWLGVLYFLGGKFAGLPGIFPLEIFWWLLRGTLAAFTIGALQLLLSMVIRSFALPIGIALVGSVAGFMLSNKGLGFLWPYALMLMGMNSNKSSDGLNGQLGWFAVSAAVYFILFSGISISILRRWDVRT